MEYVSNPSLQSNRDADNFSDDVADHAAKLIALRCHVSLTIASLLVALAGIGQAARS
jgi:hypothetical protein